MARDALEAFRLPAAGALTADEVWPSAITWIDLGPGGTPVDGQVVEITVPANTLAVGGVDSVVFSAQATTDTALIPAQVVASTMAIQTPGTYHLKFVTRARFVQIAANVTDAGVDGCNFGVVTANMASGGNRRENNVMV